MASSLLPQLKLEMSALRATCAKVPALSIHHLRIALACIGSGAGDPRSWFSNERCATVSDPCPCAGASKSGNQLRPRAPRSGEADLLRLLRAPRDGERRPLGDAERSGRSEHFSLKLAVCARESRWPAWVSSSSKPRSRDELRDRDLLNGLERPEFRGSTRSRSEELKSFPGAFRLSQGP